jgi:hypothetical protein
VDTPTDVAQRLAVLDRVIADPPIVHPDAPNGSAWRTSRRCYEFLASELVPGARTLETGAGLSTVLFVAWGCVHTAVVPAPEEADAIARYCAGHGIDAGGLTFDLRASERALPDRADDGELDLVLIDGAHSFPLPMVDWFYGAGRLRAGGVVVFDDVPMPAVRSFLDSYLELDDRWERVAGTVKWRAYRRRSEGSLSEHESSQAFFRGPTPTLRARATGRIGSVLPRSLRRRILPQ